MYKSKIAVLIAFSLLVMCICCSRLENSIILSDGIDEVNNINILATTTMLHDLASIIGGNKVTVNPLMEVGEDPHSKTLTASDIKLLENADLILYHGLHLEAQMEELFENMSLQGKFIISAENGVDKTKLLADEDDHNAYDPHIWFELSIWAEVAEYVSNQFGLFDRANESYYQENLNAYLLELERVEEELRVKIENVPKDKRILVTSHDAFQYFGKYWGFEVEAIQGISTESEATTSDMKNLADYIVENNINVIFGENSVSDKGMRALKEAVEAQGGIVEICENELMSDSLGDGELYSIIETMRYNVDTIIEALGGE